MCVCVSWQSPSGCLSLPPPPPPTTRSIRPGGHLVSGVDARSPRAHTCTTRARHVCRRRRHRRRPRMRSSHPHALVVNLTPPPADSGRPSPNGARGCTARVRRHCDGHTRCYRRTDGTVHVYFGKNDVWSPPCTRTAVFFACVKLVGEPKRGFGHRNGQWSYYSLLIP